MMRKCFFSFLTLCSLIQLGAQSLELPYSNEFNSTAKRNEFSMLRTGITGSYKWNWSGQYASHDYPVGSSGTDTTHDWLFSPALKVNKGAVLSFKYFVYGITGTAMPVDILAVWYGRGTKEPDNSTYVKLIDLTAEISAQYAWKDTSDIVLPFASDTGYIVFEYRATNNWFVVGIDSIAVNKWSLGLKPNQKGIGAVSSLYPNPSSENLMLRTVFDYKEYYILDAQGKMFSVTYGDEGIDVENLSPGIYTLILRNEHQSESLRFTKI